MYNRRIDNSILVAAAHSGSFCFDFCLSISLCFFFCLCVLQKDWEEFLLACMPGLEYPSCVFVKTTDLQRLRVGLCVWAMLNLQHSFVKSYPHSFVSCTQASKARSLWGPFPVLSLITLFSLWPNGHISVVIGCSGLNCIFSSPVCLRSLKTSPTVFTRMPKLISGVVLVGRECKQIRLQSSGSQRWWCAGFSKHLASRIIQDRIKPVVWVIGSLICRWETAALLK